MSAAAGSMVGWVQPARIKRSKWRPLGLLAMLVLAGCQATSPQRPVNDISSPAVEEVPVYTAETYQQLVRKYAQEGGEQVDYAGWKDNAADRAQLDEFVQLLAAVSPATHPGQFPTRADERSYWINAYNALVLQAVLELWPLDSVRDVKVSFSSRVIPGKGFFYDREVVVGGQTTNLYNLEKQVLKSQRDPRLHFALNCASESCPVLRPSDWTDADLDQAARDFINQPENVAVVDGKLQVSRIFKWYRKDFPTDLAAYLQQYAEPDLAKRLQQASLQQFPLVYLEYDWSLNTEAAGDAPAGESP
ncbi:MAG TPA: DUF547 domain-containing protein [Xanthomonadales bacterium]|nr:DUF547 domain-containing protein [Xanthomonadales bacterium]